MSTPSGPIRKQLGPAKKRLSDRLEEVKTLCDNEDVSSLKSVRPKLKANIGYVNTLIEKLHEVKASNDDEQTAIDDELVRCADLLMDACEYLDTANELLDNNTREDGKTAATLRLKETEKIERELENLKLESEVKRAQLANLNNENKAGGVANIPASSKGVKLPRIELPEFGGNVLEWNSFWDSYASTIHLNTNINKIDKFKYLKSCLKGEAKDAASGFSSNTISLSHT